MDAVGSNIRIDDSRAGRGAARPAARQRRRERGVDQRQDPLRVDGLAASVLDRPYIRNDGKLKPASWERGLPAIAGSWSTGRNQIGAHRRRPSAPRRDVRAEGPALPRSASPALDCRQDGAKLGGPRAGELHLQHRPSPASTQADALLLSSAPTRAAKRRAQRPHPQALARQAAIAGRRRATTCDLSSTDQPGAAPGAGRWPAGAFFEVLKNAKRPMRSSARERAGAPTARRSVPVGSPPAHDRPQGAEGWNGFNVPHDPSRRSPRRRPRHRLRPARAAGRRGIPCVEGRRSIFLLGATRSTPRSRQGASSSIRAPRRCAARTAPTSSPGRGLYREVGLCANTEAAQMANRAVFPPGEARIGDPARRRTCAASAALDDLAGPSGGLAARGRPHFARRTGRRSRRQRREIAARSPAVGGAAGARRRHARRSPISISPTRSRAPAPSMAECSAAPEPCARRLRRRSRAMIPSTARRCSDGVLAWDQQRGLDPAPDRRPAGDDRLHPARRPQDLGGGHRCAAAPTWSARSACRNPSPTCLKFV